MTPMVDQRIGEVTLIKPHSGQQRILDGVKRFTVARMGRRFGKTALDIKYLFDVAPRGIAAGYPTAWFAATNKVLADAWDECKFAFAGITTAKNEVLKQLQFSNGSSLEFWSLEAQSVARSRHYGAAVIDEAAHAPKLRKQWPQQIRPTLIQDKGWSIFSSTPEGRNYFWELDQNSLTLKDWASFHAPSWDNPFWDPKEFEDARRDMTELEFQQEFGAEYVDFSGALVRSEWLRMGRATEDDCPIALGVDLAISTKSTADYSAIVAMQRDREGKIYIVWAQRFRAPFNQILQHIIAAAERFKPRTIVIEQVQFQAAVTQELLRTTHLNVHGWKPEGDKVTRFMPLAARYEQGLVYHAEDLVREFRDEVLSFTGKGGNGHDDFVDAASCAYHGLSFGSGKIASSGKSKVVEMIRRMPGAEYGRLHSMPGLQPGPGHIGNNWKRYMPDGG